MINLITYIGKKIKNYIQEWFYFSSFVKVTLEEIIFFFTRREIAINVLFRQILFTGFEALRIISLIGLAIGGIIIIQGMTLLNNFGQSEFVYNILIIVITKELGPLLTSFILIARSGTSISTELGNMIVNHEVEALVSIGINPIRYLVVPRVLGVLVSFFCLNIYLNFTGLFGGYLVSNIVHPSSFFEFITNLLQKMTIKDLFISQIKSIIFGLIISIISCYHGLQVKFATTEVPIRTIKTVVSCLSWIFIFNITITIISYSL